MKKSFEQKMQEIIDLGNNYNPRQIILFMVEIVENFEGNERYLLLNTLYETIEFNGKIKGVQDLSVKIMENPSSIIN